MTTITDTMDVFAEKFEGIDLHGKKITKAEFDDCTLRILRFQRNLFLFRVNLPNAVLRTVI